MRLIQRNLFPRRPPSAKCDGPSILKTSSSSSSTNNPKPSSSLALKALLLQKAQPTSSSSANNNNSNTLPPSTVNSSAQQPAQALSANLNSSKLPQPPPPPPSSHRHLDRSGSSHPLSKSASLSSLLQPRSARRKGGNVQGSQDSFHVSDSSSPSLSLSSSSGSLSGGRAVLPSLALHSGAISRRSIVSRAVVDDDDHDDDIDNDDDGALFSSGQAGLNSSDQHQDCWTDVEKLVADHVGEILSKWDQIDDEIWAKVVVMERNRRVAKAYARTPVLTIAGGVGSSTNKSSPSSPSSPSTNLVGFNGHRVTLGAFANAHRDRSVRAAIRAAGDGLLVRMDEQGNLLGKRSSERSEVSLLQNLDLKQQQQQQKPAKISAKNSVLLFDMAAFRSALEKEVLGGGKGVRRSFQTSSSSSTLEKVRAALQAQCFVFLGFGNGFSANSNSSSLLRTPVWAILVNLVALEMLFSSLPSPLFHHLPHQTTENFYSLPAMTTTGGNSKDRFPNKQKQQQHKLKQQSKQQSPQQQQKMSFMNASFSSSFSSSSIPPKLPPRDLQHAKPPLTLPEPDYDEEEEEDDNFCHQRSVDDMADLLLFKNSKNKNNFHNGSAQGLAKKPQQQQQPYNDEDLYFLGYSAHVSPKFSQNVNSTLSSTSNGGNTSTTSRSAKNPPIVRKKFWSQSGSGSGSGSSHWKFFGGSAKSSQTPQNGRQIQTLDYRTTGNTSSYNSSSSSNQRPSSAYYYSTSASQLLLPPYSYNNSVYNNNNNSSSGYTDNNNSIYGVNTSLLRRTMQYQQLYQQQQQQQFQQQQQQQAMSRSVSSPSLRNIFFSRGGGGKKGAPHQKDFNNNNSRLF